MDTRAQPVTAPGVSQQAKRVGMVIGIKPDQIEAYKDLHAGPGVRDLLRQAHIHNFSIYLRQLDDGKYYEFATTNIPGMTTRRTWPGCPHSPLIRPDWRSATPCRYRWPASIRARR